MQKTVVMEELLKDFIQERNDIDKLLTKSMSKKNNQASLYYALSMQIKNDCIRILQTIK